MKYKNAQAILPDALVKELCSRRIYLYSCRTGTTKALGRSFRLQERIRAT